METNTETDNTLFNERFDTYIKKKYKSNNDETYKISSFIIPSLVSLIGTFSLFIESLFNMFIYVIKNNDSMKVLSKKVFLSGLNFYETIFGYIINIKSFTDDSEMDILSNSCEDLVRKLNNSYSNFSKTILDLCETELNEKFSEVD